MQDWWCRLPKYIILDSASVSDLAGDGIGWLFRPDPLRQVVALSRRPAAVLEFDNLRCSLVSPEGCRRLSFYRRSEESCRLGYACGFFRDIVGYRGALETVPRPPAGL